VDVITGYNWQLYHVAQDFSEAKDLAASMPDKLAELQKLFYEEAAKYRVLPLDNDRVMRLNPANRPSLSPGRTSFTYYSGSKRIPEGIAPDIENKSWSITAKLDIPKSGSEGVIATLGGLFDGWALYLDRGRPVFHYNFANIGHYEIAAQQPLARAGTRCCSILITTVAAMERVASENFSSMASTSLRDEWSTLWQCALR
jgi:hypothetical protein